MVLFHKIRLLTLIGGDTVSGSGVCRFCGSSGAAPLPAVGNVCADPDCQVSGWFGFFFFFLKKNNFIEIISLKNIKA